MPETTLPPELLEVTNEISDIEDEAYGSAVSGKFSLDVLNQLVDALNRALPLFDVPPYAKFSEAPETLPAEFVRLITMVLTAAADNELIAPVDLAAIKTDRDVQMLAGKIRTVAESRDFKEFLKQEASTPRPAPVAPPAGEMPASEEDVESLMAARV